MFGMSFSVRLDRSVHLKVLGKQGLTRSVFVGKDKEHF